MSEIENKIAPYMNNYGQRIIGQRLNMSNLRDILSKLRQLIKTIDTGKYDKKFLEIISHEKETLDFFNYVEMFKVSRFTDLKKGLNYLQFRYNFNLASSRKKLFNFPPYLLIEPNAACNLRCPMCFQIDTTFTRKPFMGIMKWDLFTKVVDEADKIGVGAITLASRGEPTMHPQFCEMLNYISKKENIFEFKINTNATRLNEKICHEIYKSNVSTVVISADHYEKKTFEELRKNANYEKIVSNVKLLYSIRNDFYKHSVTEIRISGVDFYKDLDRKKFEDFWKPISDNVSVSDPVERWDTYNNSILEDVKSPCSFLWDRMYVWHDGKVNPCDADYKSYLSYGNVKEKSISEVWNGRAIEELRKKHLGGKRTTVTPCDRCGIEFN